MWGYRFLGISFAVLAFLGLMDSGQVLAATFGSPDFSMNRPLAASPSEGSFKLAVNAGSMSTPSAHPEQPTEKAAVAKPEEPQKKKVKKASKPKKKKVKAAQSKKSEAKKPEKEEAGFLDTLKSLVVGDDTSESKLEKASGKAPAKEEPGLLTKTLKKLVGGDDDKNSDQKQARQNPLNPINVAPTVSSTQKQPDDKPQAKTAKTDTDTTLKGSFKKLIGVDAAKDQAKASNTVVKSSKQEESGVTATLKKILGGGDKKDPSAAGKAQPAKTQQARQEAPATAKQAQAETSEKPAVQTTSGQTRKYLGKNSEDEQLEKDRGGVKKGKNILKESFKTLVADENKKEETGE